MVLITMLVLKDTTEIGAPPSEVFDWFRNLPQNYRDWHPDHVACRIPDGKDLAVGSVLYAEQYLHGRLHKLRFRLTALEPDRQIRFRIAPGLRGRFEMEPTESGTRLEAEICIGWRIPVLGPVLDAALRRLFPQFLEDLRAHMREEGRNLSALLAHNARPGTA